MTTYKRIIPLLLLFMISTFLCSCSKAPLRLHVIANSDSEFDQQIKLKVRDAVLAASKDGVLKSENASQAQEYIVEDLQTILSAANEELKRNGADYTASAEVGLFSFPDKTYGDITYPAGDYSALKISLGDSKGKNWWCVMFPPLCLSEIGALDEDYSLPEDVEYSSFFAELFEKWRSSRKEF